MNQTNEAMLKLCEKIAAFSNNSTYPTATVFVRDGDLLCRKTVSSDSIDLDYLQQYEMILFESTHSQWKHLFVPGRLHHELFMDVDEEPTMEVSLDGGMTWHPAPSGVRIVYRNVMIDGEDGRGEVHFNATHEGLITDIWTTRDEPLDHNIGTDSFMLDDIVSRLVSAGDQ